MEMSLNNPKNVLSYREGTFFSYRNKIEWDVIIISDKKDI